VARLAERTSQHPPVDASVREAVPSLQALRENVLACSAMVVSGAAPAEWQRLSPMARRVADAGARAERNLARLIADEGRRSAARHALTHGALLAGVILLILLGTAGSALNWHSGRQTCQQVQLAADKLDEQGRVLQLFEAAAQAAARTAAPASAPAHVPAPPLGSGELLASIDLGRDGYRGHWSAWPKGSAPTATPTGRGARCSPSARRRRTITTCSSTSPIWVPQ